MFWGGVFDLSRKRFASLKISLEFLLGIHMCGLLKEIL